jgi:choline dehydrogenase-like flavoprotein
MIVSSTDLLAHDRRTPVVCIIGSGAAGITLACELDRSGVSVLVLEAGSLQSSTQDIDDIRGTSCPPHPEPSEFRRLGLGGTTSIWGGRCVPYDAIDFERRDYVSESGWPINYDEVAQYYPRAMQYCDAGQFDFDVAGSIAPARATIEGFKTNSELLTDRIERYSLPTDFGKRYRDQLTRSQNVTVLLNARCVGLNKEAGTDRIQFAEYIDQAGQRKRIEAKLFVVAMGGIETPRLLFNSDLEGNGLGNRYDVLGRYYACHFENFCGKLIPNGARVAFDFEKTIDGVYCRRKLQFSADTQRQHRLLNSAFRLHFPDYSDASHRSATMSTIFLAKSFLIKEYQNILKSTPFATEPSPKTEHIRNVLLGLPQLAKFGGQWLFLRQLATRKLPYTLVANADGSYPLEFNSEQTPLSSSRITLGSELDRHGLRRVHIDWRMSNEDVDAASRAFIRLRDVIGRDSVCRVVMDESQLYARMEKSIPVGGHHIGAARMAATPKHGVVDTQCAIHGLNNTYIASSAVFPTSSHANPTLTIVALAIRLAEHIRRVTSITSEAV